MNLPDIHVYESPTAPPEQRFVAMYQREKHMFGFGHGHTADEARTKLVAAREKIYSRMRTPAAKVEGETAVAEAVDLEDLF